MSMSFKTDLTGLKFGLLTILKFVPTDDAHSHWLCQCDCGNQKLIRGSHIQSHHTISCGCLSAQTHCKHGEHKTRLYKIWEGMKNRCLNPNNKSYKNYGGRGITICAEWKNSFIAFRNWSVSNGYNENLSIDRIDVNGNYEPSNCRWADAKTQCRNRHNNILVEYNNKKLTLVEVSEETGINEQLLYTRYYRGDRGERLFRPLKDNYE